MVRALLLGLPLLLGGFRVLSGSFSNRDDGMRDLLSLPFLYSLVQIIDIIQCRMCHMQFPGEQCSKGRGICIAALDEACMVGTVVASEGMLQFSFLGCLKKCANVDHIQWNEFQVNFRCCRSYDFCNEVL
ncbi:PREDICTED: prostate and testis expressed protein 1 [Miniopterus natalensis]|uniref:prostate and testis expressed protein 1 n=1 Tax=Miniopterus natalensis TaxID=291302 RepID=UPI0007A71234|nr:PREDICTED: prostate and testis expressed protein 1 [Miniopterus natalensis]